MQLGAFSISLAVQDLAVSKAFYEKLGFESIADTSSQRYAILRNGDTVIGLFEKMFEQNILTFNPGWNQAAEAVEDFTDVRQLCRKLKDSGIDTQQENGIDGDGVASFVIVDPDGNPILVDQHVPKPGS